MQAVELKLKQASAVLGVHPKDLQNLVQFAVLRPHRRDHVYWFDQTWVSVALVLYIIGLGVATGAHLPNLRRMNALMAVGAVYRMEAFRFSTIDHSRSLPGQSGAPS